MGVNEPTVANERTNVERFSEFSEDLREIAESIVDVETQEGKTLLRAADVIEHLARLADRWKHSATEWERLARKEASRV